MSVGSPSGVGAAPEGDRILSDSTAASEADKLDVALTGFSTEEAQRYREEADEIVSRYVALVAPLAQVFGPDAEVVLHNFGRLPASIVAISGDLSGRDIGGPATDLALQNLASDTIAPYEIGYESVLPNGRRCRSSSIHLFGSFRRPVGSLCINQDVNALVAARDLLDQLINLPDSGRKVTETFRRNVGEVTDDVLAAAIRSVGTSVDMMSKAQKVEVMRVLKVRGFFLLRDAVDLAGQALGVSRFTVYKYLNEIEAGEVEPLNGQ
ncbi:MAG TPA: PAS domain-containing protein [Kribbella sp.]|uniref:helix-turn-helix transcriptional regulator n=1 Tax=Kribbella sp. TaxID=1871183 RepID=UPI002D788ECA|nr:PAS domain-containing protein [Kribbella sp.]HET6293482.1 PAS domain-containing protein [Kribbella sp.]